MVFVIDSTIKGTISRSSVIDFEIYEKTSFPPISPTRNNDCLKKLLHSKIKTKQKLCYSYRIKSMYLTQK